MSGNEATTISDIVSAVQGMASSVQGAALSMIDGILPVLAPMTGAVIVAGLGLKFVRRFAR